jgi:hypothetical protein
MTVGSSIPGFRLARNLSRVDAKRGDRFLHADFPVLIARCPPVLLRVCLQFVEDTKLNVDALFKRSLA